jgi:hypothetical protein
MTDLRAYAKGKPCMIRLVGICNRNNLTTVLCHERVSGLSGGSMKAPDFFAAWGCSCCHDVVDGRVKSDLTYEQRRFALSEGVRSTQVCLFNAGIVSIVGEREPRREKLLKIVPRRLCT